MEGGEAIGQSYADRVRKGIPAAHATAVARAETQKRKIRLIKATGMVGEGMSELMEKQLVEKANIALGLMAEGEESRPEVVKFVGASKERGLGGVMYEMNTTEAATWLKEKTTMSDFLNNMGSTMDFKDQMYDVVVNWIPVSIKTEQPSAWRAVEKTSGLKKISNQGHIVDQAHTSMSSRTKVSNSYIQVGVMRRR